MNNSEKTGEASGVARESSTPPYVLPQPEQPFQGIIGKTYKDSTPHKLEIVKAPAGAPNVLYILIDDAGYGQWGTFGGQIAPQIWTVWPRPACIIHAFIQRLCVPQPALLF